LAMAAVVLDLAELIHGVKELAGESGRIQAEPAELFDNGLGRE